jgi:hydrogenase expression/formation protein HypC
LEIRSTKFETNPNFPNSNELGKNAWNFGYSNFEFVSDFDIQNSGLKIMCVAIPARVKSIEGFMAEVEVGGISRTISIQLTPEVQKDDYVLVHAGFAIHKIDEEEARETLKLFEELGALEEVQNAKSKDQNPK